MRRFSVVLTVAVFCVLALVFSAGGRSKPPTFDVASVVMIENGTHHGTGFHLGGGKILTTAHVVEGADTLAVRIEDKGTVRKVDAKVGWVDEEYDLALVVVPTVVFPSADLSCRQPVMGEQVEGVGYPMDVGSPTLGAAFPLQSVKGVPGSAPSSST